MLEYRCLKKLVSLDVTSIAKRLIVGSSLGNSKPSDEPAALKALHNFHTIGKRGYHLTPEHVETRSLYNPEKPGIEQVSPLKLDFQRLSMIDLFS